MLLTNAFFVINKKRYTSLSVPAEYDFMLTTETWAADFSCNDKISVGGYSHFFKLRVR